MYFYLGPAGELELLDGDKIAALLAGFIQEKLREAALQFDVTLVQTAYANGVSFAQMVVIAWDI